MRAILSIGVFIFCQFVFSSPLTFKGIIKDIETDEPIPFAHVVLDEVITLSNLDGQFVISAGSEVKILQVSVMGYDLATKEIESTSDFLVIYLTPSTTQLEEVTITSGDVLMRDVFNRFHLNYEVSNQHMVGYYKESLADFDSMYYLAEGIIDIYVPSNVQYNETLVSPIKTRKKVFKPIDEDVMILKGNASDMAKSSIWRKDSFLSYKNRKNYDFFYSGASTIGNKEVFIVEFEPKNSKGNTSGKIYIEEETLAVVKLEYHPTIKGNTMWKEVKWVEEFYEKNGIYELFRVSYSGKWEEWNKDYSYDALLVVNETVSSVDAPVDTAFLGENDSFFNEAAEDFTEEFWAGYNYIKLDVEATHQIQKQGVAIY